MPGVLENIREMPIKRFYIPPSGIEPGSQPIAGCALTTKLQRSLIRGAASELILQL